MQRTAGNRATARFLARDAADDEIDKIEGEKLSIGDLIDRCRMLPAAQRDAMIAKAGAHAGTTDEERLLACLLAAKFTGKMKRADFQNTYGELLAKLPANQRQVVLEAVGKATYGKTISESVEVDKRSINDIGMKGAPGSSLKVGEIVYVVVDGGVQFKTSKDGGPAGRNNNPGNITVNDAHPQAWAGDIGAYAGRSTDGRFAIFPTYAAGRAGAIAWAKKQGSRSLLEYFKVYAPGSEAPNDPQTYAATVAAAVNSALGEQKVTSDTTIDAIDALGAMQAFVDGQEKAEGFTQSNVKLVPRDSSELPQEVRDFVGGFDTATENTNAIADKVAGAPRPPVLAVTIAIGQPICTNMPSAKTMLDGYQRQLAASRGAGMAGLNEQARLAPTLRALREVVDADHDPRR